MHNLAAEAQLQTLLDALGWHGVCQADFLLEEETEIPYLIDVNPRYWGSTGHSIAAGVDEIVPCVVEIENGGSSGPGGVARTTFHDERRNRHEKTVYQTR